MYSTTYVHTGSTDWGEGDPRDVETKNSLHLASLFPILLALVSLIAMHGHAAAQESVVTVKPSAPNGWSFVLETPSGTGEFVAGPDNPPIGIGSVQLTTSSTGSYVVGTPAYAGVRLDQLTRLGYATYRSTFDPDDHTTLSLQFEIDYNVNDNNQTMQGRLVFGPTATGIPIVQGAWQTWNTLGANGLGVHCTTG